MRIYNVEPLMEKGHLGELPAGDGAVGRRAGVGIGAPPPLTPWSLSRPRAGGQHGPGRDAAPLQPAGPGGRW